MAKLEVSHRTINFNHRILNLRTVTAVTKLHGILERPVSFKQIGIAFVLFCFSFLLFGSADHRLAGAGLFLCTVLFFVYAYYQNKNRDIWALHVETAAASANLLVSNEEKPIDDAVRLITDALESDVAYHNVLNISDSMIVNDSLINNSSLANTVNKSRGASA